MAEIKPGTVQVVNTFTGEILEFEWKDMPSFAAAWNDLQQMEKAIARARGKMAATIMKVLADTEAGRLDAPGGKFIMVRREDKQLDPAVVSKYLDEDQLDLVIDKRINMGRLKEMVIGLVETGKFPAGAWDDIQENMIHKTDDQGNPKVTVYPKFEKQR